MKPAALAALPLAALLLAGCSAEQAASSASTSASDAAVPGASATTAHGDDIVGRAGLGGLSAQQIVEKLDATDEDRTSGPIGSVRPTELILTDRDTKQTQSLPLPAGTFYLAMAPYENRTHECFNHNLATCRGEIFNEDVHVKIVDKDGKNIVDQTVKTQANGFASLWVPSGIAGDLTVTHGDKKVTVPVSTAADAPTCLTTPLKLA